MFKFFMIAFLSIGVALTPVAVWSSMAKRFDEAQVFFPKDISLLAQIVDDALINNPRLKASQSKVDASDARFEAASQALYNPELDFDYENSEINTSSVGINQTIDWSDKRGGRAKVAQFDKKMSQMNLIIAYQNFSAQLLQNLSDFHTANDKNALTKLRIELLQEFVSLVKKRYQGGDVNQAQLSLAQLSFTKATIERSRAFSQLMTTKQALIVLTGSDNDQWPGLPVKLPVVKLELDKLQETINHLPKTREQMSKIETAMAKVQLRTREQNADPTIGIRAGREDSDNLIGFNLSIPLNIRNTYKSEVNVANAELIQAEMESKNLVRQLKSQLVSSASRYQITRESWLNWQKTGKKSLSKQFSIIHKQWQAGEINSTDYFLQLNQTLDTRLSVIELRHELWSTWITWLKTSSSVTQWLNLKHYSEAQI